MQQYFKNLSRLTTYVVSLINYVVTWICDSTEERYAFLTCDDL